MILAHYTSSQEPLGTSEGTWTKRRLMLIGLTFGLSAFMGAGATYYIRYRRQRDRKGNV